MRASRRALTLGAALPFSYPTHFADVAGRGGFDVVLSNPPWVRIHNIDPATRASLLASYETASGAAWRTGAAAARAGRGFASQVDLAAVFVERSNDLVREGGIVALLLPSKLWRSLAGGGTRDYIARRMSLLEVEDLSESPAAFAAAVYPSLIIARRRALRTCDVNDGAEVSVAAQRGPSTIRWIANRDSLALDDTRGAPWILVPPEVRAAFDSLVRAGVPLASTPLGRPLLGVKSGCNVAFCVCVNDGSGDVAHVCSGERVGSVETALLRPLLRGETVTPWRPAPSNDHIVWPHDASGNVLRQLPPHAREWLAYSRRALARRTDLRSPTIWWPLFRTECAATDKPRVVWSDIGRSPRALVLPRDDTTVPLNSCYVIRCSTDADAHALAALINSPVAAAWLSLVSEPALNGYRRFLGWTMSLLPIPRDWIRARELLAPLGVRRGSREHPHRVRADTGGSRRVSSRDAFCGVAAGLGNGLTNGHEYQTVRAEVAWTIIAHHVLGDDERMRAVGRDNLVPSSGRRRGPPSGSAPGAWRRAAE